MRQKEKKKKKRDPKALNFSARIDFEKARAAQGFLKHRSGARALSPRAHALSDTKIKDERWSIKKAQAGQWVITQRLWSAELRERRGCLISELVQEATNNDRETCPHLWGMARERGLISHAVIEWRGPEISWRSEAVVSGQCCRVLVWPRLPAGRRKHQESLSRSRHQCYNLNNGGRLREMPSCYTGLTWRGLYGREGMGRQGRLVSAYGSSRRGERSMDRASF